MENNLITDQFYEQILLIRDSGAVNMIDVYSVQWEAYSKGFYELVLFLEKHRLEYLEFILRGKR